MTRSGCIYLALRLALLAIAGLAPWAAWADGTPTAQSAEEGAEEGSDDLTCPDSGLLTGKLITDICWECIFPIRVAGLTLGRRGSVPPDASDKKLCLCEDAAGTPKPGFVVSMWEPARIIELVRTPGCSPALGGIRLPMDRRFLATTGNADRDSGDISMYHYHYYSFPLLIMMDLFVEDRCSADGYMDFDLLYLSELDPTWSNSELAFFTNPEVAAVANPIAQAACSADALAAAGGYPLRGLFWCAGSWGSLYPLSGNQATVGDMVRDTSLLATRATAALHRRGLAWRTMGNDALCRGRLDPMFPKTQYRASMFWPVPETRSNHVIGQSTLIWGMGRQIPAIGEDAVILMWRWNDCCTDFL